MFFLVLSVYGFTIWAKFLLCQSQSDVAPSAESTSNPISCSQCALLGCFTAYPSYEPTNLPSGYPTASPSVTPTVGPSQFPSKKPTSSPSVAPTVNPSRFPSKRPTTIPTIFPSNPTTLPTLAPTNEPTLPLRLCRNSYHCRYNADCYTGNHHNYFILLSLK